MTCGRIGDSLIGPQEDFLHGSALHLSGSNSLHLQAHGESLLGSPIGAVPGLSGAVKGRHAKSLGTTTLRGPRTTHSNQPQKRFFVNRRDGLALAEIAALDVA